MCEANVYLIDKAGKEELILEMVDKIKPEKDRIVLQSIFGEQKILTAKIKEMALVDHKIFLESL